jgi:hypothetical protein
MPPTASFFARIRLKADRRRAVNRYRAPPALLACSRPRSMS